MQVLQRTQGRGLRREGLGRRAPLRAGSQFAPAAQFDMKQTNGGNRWHTLSRVCEPNQLMMQASPVSERQPRILIVDDDGQIRQLLAGFLKENGLDVVLARDGVDMRAAVAANSFDLIVLDLMLPGTGGLELCRELRRTNAVPVIMLTAKGDETDRIVGLEVGADDYLAKPFNPRELLARIKAVLRRSGGSETASARQGYTFDSWRADVLRRELVNPGGVLVDVSGGEFDLLLAFLESPNRVLSRDWLLEAARHRTADVFDRSVDVLVSRLRRKIERGGNGTEVIKTVRGAGYLFMPKVSRA
jgi:two-component system, OmpR family, response regulator